VLGGLARRVSLVEKLKDEGKAVLVVDSGNLFADMSGSIDHHQSLIKARLISRAYKRMGAAAINVGPLDLAQGLTFLREEASRGLPLISSNLVEPSSRTPIFQPYIIKKVNKTRIAFFGLLSPASNPAIRKTEGEKFMVQDPAEAARAVIEKLRGKADVIVLLSVLDQYGEREIVKAVSGINFVLGGHEGRYIQSPVWEGQTPILESYRNGMYAGKLQLSFANAASPFRDELKNCEASNSSDNRFVWTLVPLDRSFPEDRVVSEWIRKAGVERD